GCPPVFFGETFLGFHFAPTYTAPPGCPFPQGTRLSVVTGPDNVEQFSDYFWDDFDVLWQILFRDLLMEGGAVVCEQCAAVLSKTKTGRHTKQRRCDNCRWKNWRQKKSPEEMRAKWLADYKKRTKNQ